LSYQTYPLLKAHVFGRSRGPTTREPCDRSAIFTNQRQLSSPYALYCDKNDTAVFHWHPIAPAPLFKYSKKCFGRLNRDTRASGRTIRSPRHLTTKVSSQQLLEVCWLDSLLSSPHSPHNRCCPSLHISRRGIGLGAHRLHNDKSSRPCFQPTENGVVSYRFIERPCDRNPCNRSRYASQLYTLFFDSSKTHIART
jgi:hypothetical protein